MRLIAGLRPILLPLVLIGLALSLFNLRVGDAMGEFEVARAAGRRALAGLPLYQDAAPLPAFTQLPAVAVAMAPLAVAGRDAARVAWFALSCACLVLLLRWSAVGLPARQWSVRTLIFVATVLLARFYIIDLTLGQTDVLLALLLLASLGAVQLEAATLAGVVLGLAVLFHPPALILLPWLTATAGTRAGAAGLAVLSAGLLLPAAVYGWAGNLAQLTAWWRQPVVMPVEVGNVSLAALWVGWVGAGSVAAILAALTAMLLVAVTLTVWTQRARVQDPEYLEFSLLLVLLPLLVSASPTHMLLLATPAVMLVADRWRELLLPWRLATGGAVLLLWLVPTLAAIIIIATLAQLRLRAHG